MRIFIAAELSEQCRSRLAEAIDELDEEASGLRWVDPTTAHITLKFIGDMDEENLPPVIQVMEDAVRGVDPVRVQVAGLSAFPNSSRPRVLYTPVKDPGGVLAEIADELNEGLAETLGVKREKRSFVAHATLGRVKRGKICPPPEDLAPLLSDPDFGKVEVNDIVLMKSDLTPQGAVYSVLERVEIPKTQ
jgi:2'-5' RNA ligase